MRAVRGDGIPRGDDAVAPTDRARLGRCDLRSRQSSANAGRRGFPFPNLNAVAFDYDGGQDGEVAGDGATLMR